ncbi:hypothetical protein Riv7116_2472 [Rivularia sp. PCC 7116]|nr:hypothetical protein Riv7116_2472 [Rivularia sp. PCC 7116]
MYLEKLISDLRHKNHWTKAARHTTRVVRDTKALIITLKIKLSVTAPYSINVPVA